MLFRILVICIVLCSSGYSKEISIELLNGYITTSKSVSSSKGEMNTDIKINGDSDGYSFQVIKKEKNMKKEEIYRILSSQKGYSNIQTKVNCSVGYIPALKYIWTCDKGNGGITAFHIKAPSNDVLILLRYTNQIACDKGILVLNSIKKNKEKKVPRTEEEIRKRNIENINKIFRKAFAKDSKEECKAYVEKRVAKYPELYKPKFSMNVFYSLYEQDQRMNEALKNYKRITSKLKKLKKIRFKSTYKSYKSNAFKGGKGKTKIKGSKIIDVIVEGRNKKTFKQVYKKNTKEINKVKKAKVKVDEMKEILINSWKNSSSPNGMNKLSKETAKFLTKTSNILKNQKSFTDKAIKACLKYKGKWKEDEIKI